MAEFSIVKEGGEVKRKKLLTRHECLQVTPAERQAIEQAWRTSVRTAKNREKIASEMWKIIADNLPDDEAREEHREMFDLDG